MAAIFLFHTYSLSHSHSLVTRSQKTFFPLVLIIFLLALTCVLFFVRLEEHIKKSQTCSEAILSIFCLVSLAFSLLLSSWDATINAEKETMTMKFNEKALQGIFIKKI